MLAKQLDYNVILLTNGVIKYLNAGISRYEVQWHNEAIDTILYLKQMNLDVSINVVNVKESHIDECLHFCIINDIPMHIMKLQKIGRALKSDLHEIDISITGDKGCNKLYKLLYNPFGENINCAADKFNNICKVKDCVKYL